MSEFPYHPPQSVLDHLIGTVRDADGRRTRVIRGEGRRKQMRGWDRKQEFLSARRRATPAWAKWWVGLSASGLILSAGIGVVLMVLAKLAGLHVAEWFGDTVFSSAVISLMSVIASGLVMGALEERAAIRALLSMRVCVKCFYDLRGTPDRDVGPCVCPECGAAWRVSGELAHA